MYWSVIHRNNGLRYTRLARLSYLSLYETDIDIGASIFFFPLPSKYQIFKKSYVFVLELEYSFK